MIRVALVDDDPNVHEAVQAILRIADDITLVGQVYRGEEAITLCKTKQPDILLMDVVMQGITGAEATRAVVADFPTIRVLGLSSYQDYIYIKDLLDSGAVGYLVKHAIAEDLLDTIRATAQGQSVLSLDVTRTLLSPPKTDEAVTYGLTEREIEVLTHMALGKNNKEIAHNLQVSERTVRFHLGNILRKMAVETRSEALVLAAKGGIV